MFLPRLSKPGRLLHIHLLLEVAIQERRLDVHVVDLPTFMRRQRQQQLHRLHASHRREHLVVVDPVTLCVPFDDEPRLVPYHSSMFVPLDLEHPLEPNGTPAKWELSECPGVVLLDGAKLLLHCPAPAGVLFSLGQGPRLLRTHHEEVSTA